MQQAATVEDLARRIVDLALMDEAADRNWTDYVRQVADSERLASAFPRLAEIALAGRRDWYAAEIVTALLDEDQRDFVRVAMQKAAIRTAETDATREIARVVAELMTWHQAVEVQRRPPSVDDGSIPF